MTAIGMDTEVGKIAKLLKTTSEKKTPLQVNLDQFGKKLSIMILVLCGGCSLPCRYSAAVMWRMRSSSQSLWQWQRSRRR